MAATPKTPTPKPKSKRKAKAKASRTAPSTARKRNLVQLARQEKAFELVVLAGKTIRQAAAEIGCNPETVLSDLKHEASRREAELGDLRESEKARHLAMVEDLYQKSLTLAAMPGTGAIGAAAKALEMRAKLLGLDAPTKVDLGLQTLVEALKPK